MNVGWNRRYVMHCLICQEWVSKSSKLLILTVCLAALIFGFPTPGAFVLPGGSELPMLVLQLQKPVLAAIDPAVQSVETFLRNYGAEESFIGRVSQSIVKSGRKHNLDPRLIASIVIVESRANPFAISAADSIGIMQIHLPTWGRTADREGVNLFKIEDNIDFGTRILKDYVRQAGIWDGVKRYKGWIADNPDSHSAALEYVSKIQRIYSHAEPVAATADLLQ
jgi:soluble lytic murein transglycosylase-like protein